jgi:hypothetical protein
MWNITAAHRVLHLMSHVFIHLLLNSMPLQKLQHFQERKANWQVTSTFSGKKGKLASTSEGGLNL